MKSINFFLEKRKDPKTGQLKTIQVPIFLDIHFNGKRLQHYSGYRVDSSQWDDGMERDKATGKVIKRIHKGRVRKNFANAPEINRELAKLEAQVLEIYDTAKALKIEVTKKYISQKLNPEKVSSQAHFLFEAFEEFIEIKRIKHSKNSIKKYVSTLTHLRGNEKKKLKGYFGNKRKVEFSEITPLFFEKFEEFLITKKNHSHNTTVKYCKTLKYFMDWAFQVGYHKITDYKKYKIDPEKEPAIIALDWDELMTLYNLNITNEALRQVRDVFCFGAFTGQRYSDIENLKPAHILNSVWINVPLKSRNPKPLYIPLVEYALEIINKYTDLPSGKCLPVISNQKMNKHLKDLGKLAGLNTPITIYKFIGKDRIEETVPKHDVLTTHIMRKTFVSNSMALGMQVEMIKQFTGHKSDKDFKRYLEVLTKAKIEAMQLLNQKQKEQQNDSVLKIAN